MEGILHSVNPLIDILQQAIRYTESIRKTQNIRAYIWFSKIKFVYEFAKGNVRFNNN